LEKRKRKSSTVVWTTELLLTRELGRPDLKTISKFAQLEYKLGEPERGKTLFEGMVDSHPKRWDLWSIYIDMEAGQKDVQSTRSVGNWLHGDQTRVLNVFFSETSLIVCLLKR
jgi:hypothetical protein